MTSSPTAQRCESGFVTVNHRSSFSREPSSTYRMQITAEFPLQAAEQQLDYLDRLGVGWVYLSPVLQAEPGSTHGYDVVDHSRVDTSRGGDEQLRSLCRAAHDRGMGVIADIVPNHVGVATPSLSVWWWDLLTNGRGSRYAEAFDVDWAAGNGKILLPVLGDPDDLDRLTVAGDELVYYDNRYPIAPGTAGGSGRDVHDRQHYQLIDWRRGDNELNYRRFFAITTLAAIRVEVPAVFDESHAEIVSWVQEGMVDGLRVDHPDGLFDPAGYLDRLAAAIGGRYLLVEKILEPGEPLPSHWSCDGTSGYDALGVIDRVLIDPAGEPALTALDTELQGGRRADWPDLMHTTKRIVTDFTLRAEVERLARLIPDSAFEIPDAVDALAELLASFPVYRTYLVPAHRENPPTAADVDRDLGLLREAGATARRFRPDLTASIDALLPLLRDPSTELCRRFQQTSGMVMAKGVEDCAFYRYTRLTSLTEVGADPAVFAVDLGEFHATQLQRQRALPRSMVTISTHDTKRSEDTRARIGVLAEVPDRWVTQLRHWRESAADLGIVHGDGPLLNLVFQAAVGAWPITTQRLRDYAVKAAREAGLTTTWLSPAETAEAEIAALAERICDGALSASVASFASDIRRAGRSNSLTTKLLSLTLPGVPDVYQGTELWEHSLVDPDNRRPVDFQRTRDALDSTSETDWCTDDIGVTKLRLVSAVLRLRRSRPELFASYRSLPATGSAADHLIVFDRGGAISLATRLPVGLEAAGGWGNTRVDIPGGRYTDVLSGRSVTSDRTGVAVTDVLATLPVALLVSSDA